MKTEWPVVGLEDVLTLQRGHDLPTRTRQAGRIPVIGSGGLNGQHNEAKATGPGVVLGRATHLGVPQWVDGPYWPLNTTLYVTDFKGNDPRFVYHLFQTLDLSGYDSGSVQPMLNRNYIARVPVRLPPLDEQRRIAGVLGALDDLIDANEQTIASLLALVQAKFESKFDARPLSIPLGQLALIVDCLHSKKPSRVDEGQLLLQLNNIGQDGLLHTDEKFLISSADYERWSKNLVTAAWDCVITNVGRVGAVARIPAGVRAALGRNMTAIRPHEPRCDGAFIAAALRSDSMRREIVSRTDTGTILDALNVKSIPLLRLPETSDVERGQFHDFAAPLFEMTDSLLAQNQEIGRTRDEFLPLLMSGKIRVRADDVIDQDVQVGAA